MAKKLIKIPDNRIISMDEFRSILDLWREDRKDSPLRQAAKIVTEYDNPPQSRLFGVELRFHTDDLILSTFGTWK